MKRVAVIMPTVWDRDQLARPEVTSRYELRSFGEDLFDNLPSILTRDFDLERFCSETAAAARAWGADGVIGPLDYPAALLAAEVAERLGLPSPSLRSLLTLSHKLYSRRIQQAAVPEAVPPFWLLDPEHLEAPPLLPLFVKPVKGTLSAWAREVDSREQLVGAVTLDPLQRQLFSRAMQPMNALLARFPDLTVSADHFIGEGVLTGELFTIEGYVRRGRIEFFGVVDSIFYPGTRSFERFVYPSRLAAEVQERMRRWAERVIAAAGFDDGAFDVELTYDAETDRLAIIEVNPRLCPQFSDLYEKVDGRSSYDVLLAIATGQEPAPAPGGTHRVAASCVLRRFTDGVLSRLPNEAEQEAVRRRFGDVRVVLLAREGEPLSHQLQDVGSYRYAVINLGAASPTQLDADLAAIREALPLAWETP